MIRPRWKRLAISCFVLLWTLVFHYETLRLNYLSPLVGRELPKVKFLFPPAGWIMFFHIDAGYGFAEVYGLAANQPPALIDPHRIFATRCVLYDNIRRNVLVSVLNPSYGGAFCGFLHRKFPDYEQFAIVHAAYPDVVNQPETVQREAVYRCR